MLKKIKQLFNYKFRRHILIPVKSGRFLKPFHFLKIMIKRKFFKYPHLAIVETTNTCNLNCPTCTTPRHLLGRPPRIMNVQEFKKIIDEIKNSIHIVFLYNTNEPLTNPNLAEMIKYCDKNNLYTLISTNVALMNKERADKILDAGLDEIFLCLDGMSKESYEPFRLGAKFDEVMANIEYFCREKKRRGMARPFVELQFIINKLNQGEVEKVKEFAKKMEVDRLRIKSFALGEYAYTKEEQKMLAERFLPNADDCKNKVIYNRSEDGSVKIKRQRGSEWRCKLAGTQLNILVDGRFVICCYDIKGQYAYGNIYEEKLEDILKSEKYKKIKESALNGKFPLCDICGEY